MTEPKFTPGPWEYLKDGGGVRRIFQGNGGNQIATVSIFANWQPIEEKKAAHETADKNAHLIAAAPEMYEAMKTLRDYLSDIEAGSLWAGGTKNGVECLYRIKSETVTEDLARVDAAISKAEGGEA